MYRIIADYPLTLRKRFAYLVDDQEKTLYSGTSLEQVLEHLLQLSTNSFIMQVGKREYTVTLIQSSNAGGNTT
jgi:hypothetical protein